MTIVIGALPCKCIRRIKEVPHRAKHSGDSRSACTDHVNCDWRRIGETNDESAHAFFSASSHVCRGYPPRWYQITLKRSMKFQRSSLQNFRALDKGVLQISFIIICVRDYCANICFETPTFSGDGNRGTLESKRGEQTPDCCTPEKLRLWVQSLLSSVF